MSTGKTQAVDSFAEYQEIPGVNWSTLKSLRISPKQYQHELNHEREDTPYFRIGRAAHAFVLEPDTFEQRFVCYRERRAGKFWERFQIEHRDQEILNLAEWIKAMGTATGIISNPITAELVGKGFKEHVITWTDERTRIDCKGRLDLVNGKLIDIKTTSGLQPRAFASQMARLGYHAQLAFYNDGLAANGIEVEPLPLIVAADTSPPHDVVVYRIVPEAIERGRAEYRELLKSLARCMETKHWPGIADDRIIDLDLPAWCYLGDDQDTYTIGAEQVTL